MPLARVGVWTVLLWNLLFTSRNVSDHIASASSPVLRRWFWETVELLVSGADGAVVEIERALGNVDALDRAAGARHRGDRAVHGRSIVGAVVRRSTVVGERHVAGGDPDGGGDGLRVHEIDGDAACGSEI